MLRKITFSCCAVSICLAAGARLVDAQAPAAPPDSAKPAAVQPAPPPKAAAAKLTVEQVIAKNIDAHGGLQAWRAIRAMTQSGKVDAGSRANVQLPFRLQLMRPRKSRLEIEFDGQVGVQTYDGERGWTLRPYLGRTEPTPYTLEELKKAAEQQDLDGPLFDYAAKGTKVEMVGVEQVEGRDAYKIELTFNTGTTRHIWVDADSFLETKIEEPPRVMDGRARPVTTWFRDYRTIEGLVMPFLYETAVEGYAGTHRMIVEKIELNPSLDPAAFAKPLSLPQRAMTKPRPVVRQRSISPPPTVRRPR